MTRLDELTDLLEARGDAADGLHPNLGDVRSRARRQRHSTVVVGAVASIATVAGVSAVVIRGTGNDDGQRVESDVAGQEAAPPTEAPPPYERTFPDGHVIQARRLDGGTYFGPFGDDHQWSASPGCAVGIQLDLDRPATGPNGEGSGSTGAVLEPRRAAVTEIRWQYVGSTPDTYVPAVAAIVPDARPGATYRLVVDGKVVDEATASSALLALAGPGAERPLSLVEQQLELPIEDRVPMAGSDPAALDAAVSARVQQVNRDGTVVTDEPIPAARAYETPARCTTPPEPEGIGPASPVDPSDADHAAIRDIVASLAPTGASTAAAMSHVDDPDRVLAGLGHVSIPLNMATVARAIHRDAPDHAWVRWGFQLGGGAVTPDTPDVFGGWVELHRRDGRWLMTTDSYCAFASGPVGPKCPGAPTYALLGSDGIFVDPGQDD